MEQELIPDMEPLPRNNDIPESVANDDNYVIAIPSYNRPDTIQVKTLAVLNRHHIDPKRITIFVANQQQYKLYKSTLPTFLYNNIVIGLLGLKNQRNFINSYYPEGMHIVEMDDDITKIVQLVVHRHSSRGSGSIRNKYKTQHKTQHKSQTRVNLGRLLKMVKTSKLLKTAKLAKIDKALKLKKTTKDIDDLNGFIINAFARCLENNIFLWGVYPVSNNAYFMTDNITTDLRFIVGPMWGMINRHRPELKLTVDEKENSERTLQHWVLDGAVLRFNNIGIETVYYKNKGGMQDEGKNRKQEALKSVYYLHQIYPDITKIVLNKKSKIPEIKMLRGRK